MTDVLILAAVAACGIVLLHPRVAGARLWRATTTPLASIIGSGFLVIGPILGTAFGGWAPAAMAALCALAWVFGGAVRSNIRRIARAAPRPLVVARLETAASAVLAFAYTISVAYYLNLFGAFGVSLTLLEGDRPARLLTTAVFAVILFVGWTRGFAALEHLERLSVGLKLAIITGLLVGLGVHFAQGTRAGTLVAAPTAVSGWAALTLLFGLVVTVQGFETSRYLGAAYDASTRIRSMRLAQVVASAIYLGYIVLLTYAFAPGDRVLNETAIIDLMAVVAPVLPVLLVAAALAAQFSAAVADTGGSGGLVAEITRGRVPPHAAYAILVGIGLALTWTADVFEIIAYASRAFAAYYALQSLIAAVGAWADGQRALAAGFGALALLGAAIAAFGQAVE